MQKRRVGQTNIEVSVIGLGTVKFGRNQGVKYPQSFSLPNDHDLANLISLAKELGVNFLDTAPAYGISEERIGKLLQGARHDWVISTKVGEEFVNGESRFDFSPIAIRQSVERSLLRLQTDCVDIVLVHSNGEDEKLIQELDVFSELAAMKTAGKIRAYGMSTKTIAGGKLAVRYADIVMVAFNANYTDEREVIAYAYQHNKAVLIKKAFASGHLAAAGSLSFVLAEQGVTSVVVGTIDPVHLRDNAANFLI